MESAFVKLPRPWYDLIINPPCRIAPRSPAPLKAFRKRSLHTFLGRHYALAPQENDVGVYAPSIFARKCGLKLLKILNLEKIHCMTEYVSGLRHYIKLGMLSVKIS